MRRIPLPLSLPLLPFLLYLYIYSSVASTAAFVVPVPVPDSSPRSRSRSLAYHNSYKYVFHNNKYTKHSILSIPVQSSKSDDNDNDNENDTKHDNDKTIRIMPTSGAASRSRRAPRQRITNKYGIAETANVDGGSSIENGNGNGNTESIKKLGNRRRRGTSQFVDHPNPNPNKRGAKNPTGTHTTTRYRTSASTGTSSNNINDNDVPPAIHSLREVEEMVRGECKPKGCDREASRHIMNLFQSTSTSTTTSSKNTNTDTRTCTCTSECRKDLENLTQELIASTTLDMSGTSIPLSSIIMPRDQSNLIRLLGSKGVGAYTTMLKLLHHLVNDASMSVSGCQYAYTAAIIVLAKSSSKRWKAQAIALLDEMDSKHIEPNTYTYTAAFHAVDGGKAALELLNRAKRKRSSVHSESETETVEGAMSMPMSIHLYNGAIHACSRSSDIDGKNNGWQVALSIFRTQMPRDGVAPNELTYMSLLHACAKAGQLKVAMSIFDEVKSATNMSESINIWGAALRACATTGNSKKAMEVMGEMIRGGVVPTTLHYNYVLSALAKEGEDGMAVEFFDRILVGTVYGIFVSGIEESESLQSCNAMPDLVSVNTVLTSFVKSANFTAAKHFFGRLKRGEFMYNRLDSRAVIRPDVISYNSLLSVCNNSNEAKIIMQEIRTSRRSRMYSVKPTSVTYTNAIGACKRADPPDMNAALYFLEEAQKDGIKKNVFMYSSAIWTAERCGDAKTAIFLLSSMRRNGCTPNAISYDGVLSTLASIGKFEEACSILRIMKKDEVRPTVTTFQKLVSACQNSDCSAEIIVRCFEGILTQLNEHERRAVMSGHVYTSLIKAYGELNDFDEAFRVFNSIDRANAQILSSMLFVCSAVSPVRWQDAIIILHTSDVVAGAVGRGRIEYSALSYAVIACSKVNQWQEGLNLLNIYGAPIAGKPMVSVDAVNSVIAAAGRAGSPDEAIRILNDMRRYGVSPNERTYRSVIVACNQAEHKKSRGIKRKQRFADCSKKGDRETRQSTPPSEDPLDFQWWEAALSLLRRMKEEGLAPDIQTYSSVISACEAGGQWQRALGILRLMTSDDSIENPNKYCYNAAIAACEKGGAWLEAVELYERMRDQVEPNFITMNSLLIALDKADQKELAESIYQEALEEKIVQPWKWTMDEGSNRILAMDLHKFSIPLAKISMRNVVDSLVSARPVHQKNKKLVIVVGKGKGSEDGIRVLMPEVKKFLSEEYGIKSSVDENNSGRLIVRSEDLVKFVASRTQ